MSARKMNLEAMENALELARWREEAGLTQREAAARVGVSQSRWHRWEQGTSEVPALVLWALEDEPLRYRLLEQGELEQDAGPYDELEALIRLLTRFLETTTTLTVTERFQLEVALQVLTPAEVPSDD